MEMGNRQNENRWTEKVSRENLMSVAALVVGVIFVVLAGAIFATTTWRVLSEPAKVVVVFLCAVIFYGASAAAECLLKIHRTSNACYLLGCMFLGLGVVAAGYFELLGSWFQGGRGIWRVAMVGSIVSTTAMFAGVRKFGSPIYTQTCLWCLSLCVWLTLRMWPAADGWTASGMVLYASLLLLAAMSGQKAAGYNRETSDEEELGAPKQQGVLMHFAGLNFIVMVAGLFLLYNNYWALLFEKAMWENAASLAVAAVVGAVWGCRCRQMAGIVIFELCTVNTVRVLAVSCMAHGEESLLWLLPAVSAALLLCVRRFPRLHCLGGDLAVASLLLVDMICVGFIALLAPEEVYLQLGMTVAGVLFGTVITVWGRKYKAVRVLLPFAFWYAIVPASMFLDGALELANFGRADYDMALTCGYLAVLIAWNIWKKDLFCLGITVIGIRLASDAVPDVIRLEMYVLLAALDIYELGRLFGEKRGEGVRSMQTFGYVLCLLVLAGDAVIGGKLADALILEGCCLVIFVLAQLRGSRQWVKIAGGFMVAIVLYMTKDFWLSIGWWVYLLAAGIGLLVFAAVRESRRRQMDGQE